MEQSLSDLLNEALETPFLSHTDGDLDFENFNSDGKCEEDKTDISHENVTTKEDKAQNQEGTGETSVLCSMETKESYMSENVENQSDEENDKKDLQDFRLSLMSMDQTPQGDNLSSDKEQDSSASGDEVDDDEVDMDITEKPGELWMSEPCNIESCSGNKEVRISAEEQPLPPEHVGNTQIRNKKQDDKVSIVEEFCLGIVPEHSNEMMIKIDVIKECELQMEEDMKEDTSDSECERTKMKDEQEEDILAQVESLRRGESPTGSLEFAAISVQSLQDLIVEVDSEEYVEKIKEFTGEEHEEAGESFADYPSDLASCEYVEDGLQNKESNSQPSTLPHTSGSSSNTKQDIYLGEAATNVTWMGTDEDTGEQGDGYLYSRDLEMGADVLVSFNVEVEENEGRKTEIFQNVSANVFVNGYEDADETGEADSNSSTDDEVQGRGREEELFENIDPQNPENDKSPTFSTWSVSNDSNIKNNREVSADLCEDWDFDVSKIASFLSEDLLTTEDTDEEEKDFSDLCQCPAEDSSYSVVEEEDDKALSPSYHGSLDDSFFFNSELEISELGQLGNDRHEEERSWEQEQERIKAFYKFYNNSEEENEREERQIKVQFCTESESQVIHYESDSSDTDSLSSSTDREEDMSSTETSEEFGEPDKTLQLMPGCDSPNTQLPESLPEKDHTGTHICSRKYMCLNMLKLILKMGVVIAMGLLMFWLATDPPNWLSQATFYKH